VSTTLIRKANELDLYPCAVKAAVFLSDPEYQLFAHTLLSDHQFLTDYKDLMGNDGEKNNCILILSEKSDDGILVDSEGYTYARYAAPFPGAKAYLEHQMGKIANRVLFDAAQSCKGSVSFLDYDSFRDNEGFDLRRSTYLLELLKSKMKENFGVYSVSIGIEGISINMDPELCLDRCRFAADTDSAEKEHIRPDLPNKSAKSLLKAKIESVYAEYKTKWLQMTPEDLIANCEEVEAVTRMYKDAPDSLSEDEAEYLLRFKDPLAVLSDEWNSRNSIGSLIIDDEVSSIMWELMDKQSAEECYEMEPGYQNADRDPTMTM